MERHGIFVRDGSRLDSFEDARRCTSAARKARCHVRHGIGSVGESTAAAVVAVAAEEEKEEEAMMRAASATSMAWARAMMKVANAAAPAVAAVVAVSAVVPAAPAAAALLRTSQHALSAAPLPAPVRGPVVAVQARRRHRGRDSDCASGQTSDSHYPPHSTGHSRSVSGCRRAHVYACPCACMRMCMRAHVPSSVPSRHHR